MQKWVEISKAKEELDIEFDYLYDLVVNGSVKATLNDDEVLIDVSSLPNQNHKSCKTENRSYKSLKQELEDIREEYVWLKSENMRNDNTIRDYHIKFNELKAMNKHLMDVIAEQAEVIRELKGYSSSKAFRFNEQYMYNSNSKTNFGNNGLGISMWMLLPVIGLILTALFEFFKTYHVINLAEIFRAFGV